MGFSSVVDPICFVLALTSRITPLRLEVAVFVFSIMLKMVWKRIYSYVRMIYNGLECMFSGLKFVLVLSVAIFV